MDFFNDETKVVGLGGLEEIGKNMYVVSCKNELIIIDAGVMFPEDELLGVDYVIQDISFLKENEDKIKGLFITHGHEDHIGGISFLLQSVNIPVIYASNIAKDLITKKLAEKNIKYENIQTITPDLVVKYKYLSIEFITVTHSIPGSYGMAIHTPNGTVVTTGDFKFDLTPIGECADFAKLARLGTEGVKLLLTDSTNALVPGFSKSESLVDDALNDIFSKTYSRIIIATFASNIYRLKHIVETCKRHNRKIITFGRSMENSIQVALNNNLIQDKSIFIDTFAAKDLKKNEICILCTGSQGEPLAALSRIANGTHKQIKLMPDDLVVFSSSPIPGNTAAINRIINKLYLKGVKVYTNSQLNDIHTSGHAKIEDLKLLFRLIKPEYFMPIHGEYRMLKHHGELAELCGVQKENIFLCKNGDVVSFNKEKAYKNGKIQAGDVYVDGSRIGDVGSYVLKDRKLMSKDGILMTILNIDVHNKKLLLKPNITTRGFILVNENPDLIKKIERKVDEIVTNYLTKNHYNYIDLKNQIIYELNLFIKDLIGRRPIITPIIMEVK